MNAEQKARISDAINAAHPYPESSQGGDAPAEPAPRQLAREYEAASAGHTFEFVADDETEQRAERSRLEYEPPTPTHHCPKCGEPCACMLVRGGFCVHRAGRCDGTPRYEATMIISPPDAPASLADRLAAVGRVRVLVDTLADAAEAYGEARASAARARSSALGVKIYAELFAAIDALAGIPPEARRDASGL